MLKMKLKILFFLVLLTANCFAQRFNSLGDDDKFIDSISDVIKTTKDDSLRSISSFKIADLYRRNKDKANFYNYLQIGNQYKTKYPYLVDCSEYYNALNFLIKNDIPSYSKKIAETVEKLKKYKNKDSYELQTIIYQNLSIIKRIEDKEKESMDFLVKKAIVAAKKSENHEFIGDIYKHIGIALMNNGDREKAKDYYLLAISNYEKAIKHSPNLLESKAETYIITAENFSYLDKIELSNEYLEKAFSIVKRYPKSNLNGMYYFSKGLNFYKQSKFNKAIDSYDKGITNCIENNDILSLNRLKFVKYQSLIELGKLKEANSMLIDLIENGNLMIEDKKNYYKEVALSFNKLGDYKSALDYANRYIILNDSLVENGIKKEILTLEAKFNSSEKEKKILQLEKEKAEKEIRLKNLRLRYGLVFTILIIALILFYFLYKNFKNQKRINAQKDIIHEQKLEFINSQKEIEIMQAMIDGEEAERKRIARDLHDGIGSRLSSLKMQVNQVEEENLSKLDINSLAEGLSKSIVDLRRTAFNLVPETLTKLGLELALQDLCFSMSNKDVKISFTSNNIQDNLIESNQIAIFRIIQELINNALKHSNCTEIVVDCSQNNQLFLITVEDNGIGFNTKELNSYEGLGLKNIKSRIELLKGNIEVISGPSQGTIFNIELLVQVNDEKKV